MKWLKRIGYIMLTIVVFTISLIITIRVIDISLIVDLSVLYFILPPVISVLLMFLFWKLIFKKEHPSLFVVGFLVNTVIFMLVFYDFSIPYSEWEFYHGIMYFFISISACEACALSCILSGYMWRKEKKYIGHRK